MLAEVNCEEYLDEVKEQVWGHCPAQGCWDCGVKQQLGQLVESIHDADEVLDDPALFARLVSAVRSVDERHVQWEVVRRHVDHTPRRQQRVPVAAMIQAYETETGTCIGCD
jgi:hypothetical protein